MTLHTYIYIYMCIYTYIYTYTHMTYIYICRDTVDTLREILIPFDSIDPIQRR